MVRLVRTGIKRNDRAGARRRTIKADTLDVPTFQTETPPARPQSIATVEDPAEEAVRRMVEAAYT